MAVPKRRQSKSRSAIRRAQVMKKPVPNFVPCPRCGEPKLLAPDVRRLRLLPRPAGDRAEGRGAGLRAQAVAPHAPHRRRRHGLRRRASRRGRGRRGRGARARHRGHPGRRRGAPARRAGRARAPSASAIVVRHAPEVITMHDAPSMAVKQKKKSSMRVCFDLVKAGRGRRGRLGRQLGRDDGVRAVRARAAARRRAAGHRHHLPDQGRRVRAARHGRQRRSQAGGAGAVRACSARSTRGCCTARRGPGSGLLSNGSEEHKGTPLTRDAHQLLARVAGAPATPTSATSATSRGATSSGARSTWSSPTGSPATSCSRASRAPRRRSWTWCARRSRARACWPSSAPR